MAALASRIEKLLVSPRTVANALNSPMNLLRPILSLHVGETAIDLALITHPGNHDENHLIHSLPSISVEHMRAPTRNSSSNSNSSSNNSNNNLKLLKAEVLQELSSVVNDYKVCGLVVSWPVQKEGRFGAPCGKVLHALDQIVQDTNIVTPNRPVCLWDGHHFHITEDKFERPHNSEKKDDGSFTPTIGASMLQEYNASQTQYHEDGMLAAAVAADYLRSHWPNLTRKVTDLQDQQFGHMGEVEDWEEPLWTQPPQTEDLASQSHAGRTTSTGELDEKEAAELGSTSVFALTEESTRNQSVLDMGEIDSDEEMALWTQPLNPQEEEQPTSLSYDSVDRFSGEIDELSEEPLWIEPAQEPPRTRQDRRRIRYYS